PPQPASPRLLVVSRPPSLLRCPTRSRRPPSGERIMSKHTVSAPANIAFVKYWGASDLERALPLNSSISMTLDECVTLCTAEPISGTPHGDEIWLAEPDGRLTPASPEFSHRVLAHIERLRRWAGRS